MDFDKSPLVEKLLDSNVAIKLGHLFLSKEDLDDWVNVHKVEKVNKKRAKTMYCLIFKHMTSDEGKKFEKYLQEPDNFADCFLASPTRMTMPKIYIFGKGTNPIRLDVYIVVLLNHKSVNSQPVNEIKKIGKSCGNPLCLHPDHFQVLKAKRPKERMPLSPPTIVQKRKRARVSETYIPPPPVDEPKETAEKEVQVNISTIQHKNQLVDLNVDVAVSIMRIIDDQLDGLFHIMRREPIEDFDKYYSAYELCEENRSRTWKALYSGGASDIRTLPYYRDVNTFLREKKIDLNDDGSIKPSNKEAIKIAVINSKRRMEKPLLVNNKRKMKIGGQSDISAKKSKHSITKNSENSGATSNTITINENKRDSSHKAIKSLAEPTKHIESRSTETRFKDIRECLGNRAKYISNRASHGNRTMIDNSKINVVEAKKCAFENESNKFESHAGGMESKTSESATDEGESLNKNDVLDNANGGIALECEKILIEQSDYGADKENTIEVDKHNEKGIEPKDVSYNKGMAEFGNVLVKCVELSESEKKSEARNDNETLADGDESSNRRFGTVMNSLDENNSGNVLSPIERNGNELESPTNRSAEVKSLAKPKDTRGTDSDWKYEFLDAYGKHRRLFIPQEYREPLIGIPPRQWISSAHITADLCRSAPKGEIVRTYMRDKYGLYALVELLRDMSTRKDVNYECFVADRSRTILAGRYLAFKCNADPNKPEYGLDEIKTMQEYFEREYPGHYGIEVYRNLEDGSYSNVIPSNAGGTEEAKHIIRIIQWYDYDTKSSDYFGLLGSLKEFLEANKSELV